jgi:hypothetical protein
MQHDESKNRWKELAFAKEGQMPYYFEQWERLQDDTGPIVALQTNENGRGIIVIVGDHFSYCFDRKVEWSTGTAASLVELVDEAVSNNDLDQARAWLSMRGGHGTISSGWTIDCSIEPWVEGRTLWEGSELRIEAKEGAPATDCRLLRFTQAWNVTECNLSSKELAKLLSCDLKVV